MPGPVRLEQSRGPHGLIKQGAKLVESVQDIVEELLPQLDLAVKERLKQQPPSPGQNRARLEDEEAVVYQLLSDQPTPIDELIVKSGLPAGRVTSVLLAIELKGLARRLPGSCSVRV